MVLCEDYRVGTSSRSRRKELFFSWWKSSNFRSSPRGEFCTISCIVGCSAMKDPVLTFGIVTEPLPTEALLERFLPFWEFVVASGDEEVNSDDFLLFFTASATTERLARDDFLLFITASGTTERLHASDDFLLFFSEMPAELGPILVALDLNRLGIARVNHPSSCSDAGFDAPLSLP